VSGNDKPARCAEDSGEDQPVTDDPQSVDAALDVSADTESDAEPSDADPDRGSASGPEAGPDEAGSGAAEAEPEPAPREPTALELLTAERDQHLNDLQRVTAEFANFRKQTEKRNAETVRQAAARVMQAILPVLDACDAAALQQVEGVEPITAQLRSVLEAQGLEIIDQTEPFDPNRHEAAMSEPGDEDQTEPMVSEVLRTGYAFNGRVLRAAMVKVKG